MSLLQERHLHLKVWRPRRSKAPETVGFAKGTLDKPAEKAALQMLPALLRSLPDDGRAWVSVMRFWIDPADENACMCSPGSRSRRSAEGRTTFCCAVTGLRDYMPSRGILAHLEQGSLTADAAAIAKLAVWHAHALLQVNEVSLTFGGRSGIRSTMSPCGFNPATVWRCWPGTDLVIHPHEGQWPD